MTLADTLTWAATFVGAALLSLWLTPLAIRLGVRRGLLDRPGGHKSHAAPVPVLGGAAVVLAFGVAVLVGAILRPPDANLDQLVAIVAVALGVSLLGLADDLRGLPVSVRLAAEVAAGVVLWAVGVRVELLDPVGLDLLITVVWVVGITNALNLLDNMDGLSAGTTVIAGIAFFVLAVINGQVLVAALAAGVAGCALGFLRHNFHPARIHMGDAGSLFFGLVLAALGIKLRFEGRPLEVTFLVPILVLGVPIFDTALVVVSRLRHGRSPFEGGRDHTSHRLVASGLPVRAAVSLVYAAAIALGWLAVVVARLDAPTAWILVGLVGAIAAFLGGLLAAVPTYPNSRGRRFVLKQEPSGVTAGTAPRGTPGGSAGPAPGR